MVWIFLPQRPRSNVWYRGNQAQLRVFLQQNAGCFGAEVYRKSTDESGLGESAGKDLTELT
jgi:hypothetical protein